MNTIANPVSRVLMPLVAVLLVGCGPEFDPIEQVQGLRVLAIAADTPELSPGERTTIRALVRSEPETTVAYAWDWCPFPASSADEYTCPLAQSDLDELSAAFGIEAPRLSLGTTPEVELDYTFVDLLELTCEIIASEPDTGEEGVPKTECDEPLPITLRLIVTQPDGGRVVAVKRMVLRIAPVDDPSDLNTNPIIDGVRLVEPGKDEEDAVELVEGEPFAISFDTSYTLLLDLGPTSSQTFTPEPSARDLAPASKQENLLVYWYYEGGLFEKERTGFNDGLSTFEDLGENVFVTPKAGDFPAGELDLFFVIQDERGGIGWAVRTLRLE